MLRALVDTCVIEAAVTFLIMWLKGFHETHKRRKNVEPAVHTDEDHRRRDLLKRAGRMVYYNLLCNMLTNPLLNLSLYGAVLLGAGRGTVTVLTVIGEICVVASEYGLYRLMSRESRRLCLVLSIVTNAASYLVGLLL